MTKITKKELLNKLNAIQERALDPTKSSDEEDDHVTADKLLLEYIDSEEISRAFNVIDKWYS